MAKNYKYRRTFSYDGHRYDIRADSELEIIQKWAKKLQELEQGSGVKSSNVTVRDYALHCYDTYRRPKVSPLTYDKYINRLENCILSQIGNMKVNQVRRVHCQQCLNAQEGNSKYQIKQTEQMLHFIFSQAILDDLIIKDPSLGIVEPKGTKQTRRSFTSEEQDVFLKVALDNPKFKVFLLSFFCGCRPEEARNVKGEDIYLDNDIPMIHIRGTKSANADRIVPLDTRLYDRIKSTAKADLIAPNMAGNHHNQNTYKRAWDNLCREMNIGLGCKVYRNRLIEPLPLADDLSPYCLRHTYCTNLQKAGVPLTVAQKLMGHSTITLTADIYTHTDREDIRMAAELIEGCGNKCGNPEKNP